MVEENLLTTKQVCEILGISLNNLHQIQFRKTITWAKREGRKVYYDRDAVMAYHEKRSKRGKKTE